MNYIKQLFLGICTLLSLQLYAQDAGILFDKLESELFPLESERIYLYELIACKNHQIDSSILVRKRQPEAVKVLELLGKIMHAKKSDEIERLQSIYDRHIQNFMREWAKAYSKNLYACKPIQSQFNILKGFEHVLKSLDFRSKKFSYSEIFQFYIDEMHLNFSLIKHTSDRNEILKKYKIFSESFRIVNSKAWLGGTIPFHYLDPYLEELSPYFIDYLYECNWDSGLYHSESCLIVKSSNRFYYQLKDEKIADYMIENYDIWYANYKSVFIWTYAGRQFDERLSRFLVKRWIKQEENLKEKTSTKKGWIRLLLNHKNNWDVVLESLIELGKDDFEKTIKMIKYLPREDVLVRLEEFGLVPKNVSLVQEIIEVLKPMNKEK